MPEPSQPNPVFLIVDPDAFVAEDLAEILRETVAGAQVIHATRMDAHMMRIVSEMSVYGVFLNGTAEGERMRAISDDLHARDVGLAWIGSDGHRGVITDEVGLKPIVAPFTAEAVLDVIASWGRIRPISGRDRPGRRPAD